MKPLIGIVEWPYQDKDGDVIYEILQPIIEWVVRSGGVPIGLFPTQIENYVEKRLRDIKKMSEIVKLQKEKRKEVKRIIKRYKENRKEMKYSLKQDKNVRNSAIDDMEL